MPSEPPLGSYRPPTVLRPSGQEAGPISPVECRGPRGKRSRWRSHCPSRPWPKRGARAAAGLRPLPSILPSRTLSLLHKPSNTTRTPDPLFILETLSPLVTLFYYFRSIKASPTVSVVCASCHSVCARSSIGLTYIIKAKYPPPPKKNNNNNNKRTGTTKKATKTEWQIEQ